MQAAVAVAVMIFSCGVTLNPDGSGKAVIEVRQSAPAGEAKPALSKAEGAAPTQAEAMAAAKSILGRCKGVDTWVDLAVGVSPDGLMTFKGTAYFKDLGQFRVDMSRGGTLPVTWEKDPKGGQVLQLERPGGPPPPKPAELSPEELDKQVEEVQKSWKETRVHMAPEAQGSLIDLSYKLPGEPAEVAGFKKEADGSLHIRLDGTKFVAALDAFMADAKALASVIQATGEGHGASLLFLHVIEEKVLGAKFPFTARVAGEAKPQFDYAAEVKAAKEGYIKMLDKAGLDDPPEGTEPITIQLEVKDDKGEDLSILIGGKPMGSDFGVLEARLAKWIKAGAAADRPIVIAPSTHCPHKFEVSAFDAATKVGFKNIRFAVPYEPAAATPK
jgi:hypothetical protein